LRLQATYACEKGVSADRNNSKVLEHKHGEERERLEQRRQEERAKLTLHVEGLCELNKELAAKAVHVYHATDNIIHATWRAHCAFGGLNTRPTLTPSPVAKKASGQV
jgi:hypothetical protein